MLFQQEQYFMALWNFAGNSWDHSPPNLAATLTVDGTDVTAISSPLYGPAHVDTSGSTAVDIGCSTP
jgi:hypothetical protein